jgi:CDGSH-type Zn-finger protein
MTQDSTIQDSLIQDDPINERREAAARIVVIRNGPYELDGAIALVDHLGVPIAAQAPVRLCRCGQSQTKPFCDDSHLSRGFTDNKDPRREPDKLDLYEGQQAYIYTITAGPAHIPGSVPTVSIRCFTSAGSLSFHRAARDWTI